MEVLKVGIHQQSMTLLSVVIFFCKFIAFYEFFP